MLAGRSPATLPDNSYACASSASLNASPAPIVTISLAPAAPPSLPVGASPHHYSGPRLTNLLTRCKHFHRKPLKGRKPDSSHRVREVRIHFPPADSPSLAGFLVPVSKSRQLPRGAPAWPGGTAGRDAQGSPTSRQPPVISLSGPIPVPQCRLVGSRPWLHWCAKRGRVSHVAKL